MYAYIHMEKMADWLYLYTCFVWNFSRNFLILQCIFELIEIDDDLRKKNDFHLLFSKCLFFRLFVNGTVVIVCFPFDFCLCVCVLSVSFGCLCANRYVNAGECIKEKFEKKKKTTTTRKV